MTMKKSSSRLLALAVSSVVSNMAFAAPEESTTNASDQQHSLETMIVTAQRRAESTQDMPISISAFSSEMLEQKGIERPTDLVSSIPNVDFFSFFGESSNPSFCFRSICMNVQFSDSFEPPVAMYTNDVYVSSGFSQSLQMFDVDRIEVLKGPQGTLYGRNTTGGLVNVVTKRPTDTLSGTLSVDYGTDNDTTLTGAISGPLTDNIRGRLAVQNHTRDAYVEGDIEGSDANDADSLAIRGTLEIDLGSASKLTLISDVFKVREGAQASTLNGTLDPETGETCTYDQLQSGNCVGIYGRDDLSANTLYENGLSRDNWLGADIEGGYKPRNDVDTFNVSGTFETEFSNGMSFESITAYVSGQKDYIEDLDGAMRETYDDRLTAETQTWSQEFRLLGDSQYFSWITGLFYFNDSKDVTTGMFPTDVYYDWSTKTAESAAIYADADIPLAGDALVLTLGGRFTSEDRDLDFNRTGSWVDENLDEHRSTSNSNFDWRAVLTWNMADSTMAYASAATAFRSANMNNQSQWGSIGEGSELDSLRPVDPEHMRAYEMGFKSDFLGSRMRFNASMFYYEYTDMQYGIYVFDADLGIGASRLRNLSEVNAWGGEAELTAFVTDNLQLNLAYGNTRSAIKDDVTSDGRSLQDSELPMSNPTASFGATYDLGLSNGSAIKLMADYSWKDDHYFSINNEVTRMQEAYGVADIQAVWTSPSGRYEIEAYGSNITDEKYAIYAGEIYDNTQNIVWGMGRQVGAKFTYNF